MPSSRTPQRARRAATRPATAAASTRCSPSSCDIRGSRRAAGSRQRAGRATFGGRLASKHRRRPGGRASEQRAQQKSEERLLGNDGIHLRTGKRAAIWEGTAALICAACSTVSAQSSLRRALRTSAIPAQACKNSSRPPATQPVISRPQPAAACHHPCHSTTARHADLAARDRATPKSRPPCTAQGVSAR